ncbi:MAG: hypothetical protein Q4F82_09310 [bacterium]|nr:hypothetical protein [bacterium]
MKRFTKVLAAILLMVAVVVAAGCKKPDDPNNPNNGGNNEGGGNGGGGNSGGGTTEGLYMGIIGFNDELKTKSISLLNNSTEQDFINFIESLTPLDNTALYHADNTALDWLQEATLPSDLISAWLVTFTDGLDNASLMLNSNYDTQAEFLNAVNNRIMNDKVQGLGINAHAIGLKGKNNTDEASFRQTLRKLASSSANLYIDEDMDLIIQRFRDIANQLYNEITTVDASIKVPGGYDNNTIIRLTFDNVSDALSSTRYIQATFSRENGKGKLSNINYYGLQSTSGSSVVSTSQQGASYWYTFSELKTPGANGQAISDLGNMKLWIYNSSASSWRPEDEFTPDTYSNVTVERKSAVAIMVLDCTTSLGAEDFRKMQNAAIEFIHEINNNSGGSNGGNSGGGNSIPDGIINGKFSVSTSQKVYFSKGNLQYQPSTCLWRFAEHQYDYIGNANSDIGQYYANWIDLFGWGTSDFAHGATCYQPYSTSQNYNDYLAYGSASANLNDQTGLADWGVNAISNGGNETRVWRTLTKDEWSYLLTSRSTSSGKRYSKAEVAGKNGLIILPDDWSNSTYTLNNANSGSASFSDNVISSSTWSTLEAAGAVFLPAAGSRAGTSVSGTGTSGYYWSSSCQNPTYAYLLSFNENSLSPYQGDFRYYGQSVRVVCEAE